MLLIYKQDRIKFIGKIIVQQFHKKFVHITIASIQKIHSICYCKQQMEKKRKKKSLKNGIALWIITIHAFVLHIIVNFCASFIFVQEYKLPVIQAHENQLPYRVRGEIGVVWWQHIYGPQFNIILRLDKEG